MEGVRIDCSDLKDLLSRGKTLNKVRCDKLLCHTEFTTANLACP